MRVLGLVVAIISIITVFFQYKFAIFLFGIAMVFFGVHQLQGKNKAEGYIYLSAAIIFIVGILIKEF